MRRPSPSAHDLRTMGRLVPVAIVLLLLLVSSSGFRATGAAVGATPDAPSSATLNPAHPAVVPLGTSHVVASPPAQLPASPRVEIPPGAPGRAVAPHAPGGSDCFGRWPVAGQSAYANDCYGHDEPGLEPFSNLPGSGGNVTWNVTLPTDASPTHNQSDLYTAVWFGMDLTDPLAYLGQCFLELQLYPDYNAAGVPQVGVWSAYAIAWELSLATGTEDPCYQSNLTSTLTGNGLQMNEGDHLLVRMSGWQGSPYGENLSIRDVTSGDSAFLNLYNTFAGYPLNPVYLANNIQDSLPWSPGGDLPVSFAFEAGHTISDPSNSSFGGCSSGAASALDPSAPCGSYDPARWAQDTGSPWLFHPTIFSSGSTQQTASQLGFIQDFGGIAWIDPLSNGTCVGKDGSAGCSYPWFSYQGASGSLSFGATDFPGTTEDFGQYNQYFSPYEFDSAGLYFYAVQNFTPTNPSGPSLTIVVQGDGSVRFLNHVVRQTTTFPGLSAGSYSINSLPSIGNYFGGYSSTGGVSLDAALTAWSSFSMSSGGTITATFSTSPPPNQRVTFGAAPLGGNVSIVPGFAFAPQPMGSLVPTGVPGFGRIVSQATTVPAGQTIALAPGIYSAQALPPPGFKFVGWSASGGLYVFSPASNYTWFNVTGPLGHLVAHYAPTPAAGTVTVNLSPRNGGVVFLNGVPVVPGRPNPLASGAYRMSATPSSGFGFATWTYSGSAMLTNFSAVTWLQVQHGNSTVTAVFNSTPLVTVATGGHGTIAVNGVVVPASVNVPVLGTSTVPVLAVPSLNYSFSGWSMVPANAGTFGNATIASTTLQLHTNGTLTATFVPSPSFKITVTPGSGGGAQLGLTYAPPLLSTGVRLPVGVFPLVALPLPGETLASWGAIGGVSVQSTYVPDVYGNQVLSYTATVTGVGTLSPLFQTTTFPVTFVPEPFVPSAQLLINSSTQVVTLNPGQTANLSAGVYRAGLLGGPYDSIDWRGTSNLSTVPSGVNAQVTVTGSGSLYVEAPAAFITWTQSGPLAAVVGAPFALDVSVTDPHGPYSWRLAPHSPGSSSNLTCSPWTLTTLAPNASFTCTANAGSNLVDWSLTDSLGNVVGSTLSAVVAAAPTATLSVGPSIVPGSGAPLGFLNASFTLSPSSPTSPTDFLEVLTVLDSTTGAVLTRGAGPVGIGDPNLLVSPALPAATISLGPSDFSNGLGGLGPGAYSIVLQVWYRDIVGPGGAPLYLVGSTLAPLSVLSVGIRSPSNGSSMLPGPVTINYDLAGAPAFSAAWLNVTTGGSVLALQDVRPAQAEGEGSFTLNLANPGSYEVALSVALSVGPNSYFTQVNVTFAVISPAAPGPAKLTWTQIGEFAGGGAVVGLLLGILAMWVLGRRTPRSAAQPAAWKPPREETLPGRPRN